MDSSNGPEEKSNWEFVAEALATDGLSLLFENVAVESSVPLRSDILSRITNALRDASQDRFTDVARTLIETEKSLQALSSAAQRVRLARAQFEVIRKKVHRQAVDTAAEWVSADPDEALEVLMDPDYGEFRFMVFSYSRVAIGRQMRNARRSAGEISHDPLAIMDNIQRFIDHGGGAQHLLVFGLALLITEAALMTFLLVARLHPVDSLLIDDEDLMKRVAFTLYGLWGDEYIAKVQWLADLPSEFVYDYIEQENTHLLAERSVLSSALGEMGQLRTQLQGLHREREVLRADVRRLGNEIAVREAVQQKPSDPPAISSSRGTRDNEIAVLQAKNERCQVRLNDALRELAELRALFSATPEPPVVESSADSSAGMAAVEAARFLFVGGHEKLHARLRKELPNATYIHPDQSHLPIELLSNTDYVVFLFGYCNHRVAEPFLQEARRRGITVGYSKHHNLGLVMADLRNLVGKPKAAQPVIH